MQDLQRQGWEFRKTTLSDEFTFEDALAKLPHNAHVLLTLRASGRLRFFTHAARPEPRAGDTVISYAPPQPSAAEEKAVKRKAEKQATKAKPA